MIPKTNIERFIARCPECNSDEITILNEKERQYQCNNCQRVFVWKEAEIEIKYYKPHNE